MFNHCLLRPNFVGAGSNAFAVGKHEPLMKVDLIDDVLGHFES
jgi:hypothetical protein